MPVKDSLGIEIQRTSQYFGLDTRWRVFEASLEFRAEFFNLFNFVNFGQPNNNMTMPGTVGRIIPASTGPRVIQCAMKYSF
jgi:hypothetical protein